MEIEPYEKTLLTMSKAERDEWAERVIKQIGLHWPRKAKRIVWLAGSVYIQPRIVEYLKQQGIKNKYPLAGLGIGKRMQWLKQANQI